MPFLSTNRQQSTTTRPGANSLIDYIICDTSLKTVDTFVFDCPTKIHHFALLTITQFSFCEKDPVKIKFSTNRTVKQLNSENQQKHQIGQTLICKVMLTVC